jgi:hypothetical protein
MRLSPLALGVALSAAACVPALAQQQTPMPAIQPQRQMKFDATLNALYDSNVARSDDATAKLRGVKPEDDILTPGVRASIVQTFGRQALFLQGDGGYEFHRRNHQLNRQRANVVGGLMTRIGQGCQEELYSAYRAQQSDLADIIQGTVKNLQQSTSVAAGVSCARETGLGGLLQVQREDVKNSDHTQKIEDVTSKTLSTQVSYGRPSLGTVGLVYSYARNEFPNRINPGRPVGDSFQVQSYGLQVQKKFTPKLHADATVTRTMVKREFAPAGVPLKSKLTSYTADVFYGLGARIDLEAHATRSVQPSDRIGKLYDILKAGEVAGHYKLGSRFLVTAGYRLEDTDSNFDTAVPVMVVTNSRLKSLYGSIRYRQSERLSLLLDLRHETRDTNLPSFNYTSNRVGLTAEAAF